MIDVVRARSGAAVLKVDGRYLASRVDPVREGERWAERAAAKIPAEAGAVVLGLGSVHGPAALQRLLGRGRMIVLEPHAELLARARDLSVAAFEPILNFFDFSAAVCVTEPQELFENEVFSGAMQRPFRVVINGAGVDVDPEWHRRALELILAREPAAAAFALSARLALNSIVEIDEISRSQEAISVKSIVTRIREGSASREASIWRALSELIV